MNKKTTVLLKHLKEIKQNPDDLLVTFNTFQTVSSEVLYSLKRYLIDASNEELVQFIHKACSHDEIDNVYDVLAYYYTQMSGYPDSFLNKHAS